MNEILMNNLKKFKTVSIIGMDKNVGKTTTLNWIINQLWGRGTIAITSIGVDGEGTDIVTSTTKPRVYVEKGTIVATAKDCLGRCDITKEVLQVTDFATPIGNVVIVRALSDGFVEIAGPSSVEHLKELKKKLMKFKPINILIDGALFRKSLATPSLADGVILATGASLSENMDDVIYRTSKACKILALEEVYDDRRLKIAKKLSKQGYTIVVNKDTSFIYEMPAKILKEAFDKVSNETEMIILGGAVTNSVIESLIINVDVKQLDVVVPDSTKIVADFNVIEKFLIRGGNFKVLSRINLFLLTANPTSPEKYCFPKSEFIKVLSEKIDIPVLDIREDEEHSVAR